MTQNDAMQSENYEILHDLRIMRSFFNIRIQNLLLLVGADVVRVRWPSQSSSTSASATAAAATNYPPRPAATLQSDLITSRSSVEKRKHTHGRALILKRQHEESKGKWTNFLHKFDDETISDHHDLTHSCGYGKKKNLNEFVSSWDEYQSCMK